MKREEDFELVRRLCSGKPEHAGPAFDALYAKYRDRVYNIALRVLNDRTLAADITQETFLGILRKARKFRFRSAFSSWLYRVTVNLCIDARRKRERRRPLSLNEPQVAAWVEDAAVRRRSDPGPEEQASRGEFERLLSEAIGNLNPKLAAVVVLRYVEGLGYEEIADILRVPLGTVKSRLNRAHAALAEVLEPKLGDYL